MAEFIGETNGTTKISQIPVNGTIDGQHLIAYAAYNGSVAARMALVNFNEWSNMNSTARPSSTFSLTGLGCTHVTVKYLSSDEGATGLADGIHLRRQSMDRCELRQGSLRGEERYRRSGCQERKSQGAGPIHLGGDGVLAIGPISFRRSEEDRGRGILV